MLKAHPGRGDAWWGLADLKQAGLGDDDIPAMQAAIRDPHASERDRIALGFAIARVLELPGNWTRVGAVRAMLPAAKVIVCRCDPLETCFSCYRQYMTADGQGWTHRFEDLAAYWNAFDRALQQWQSHHSGFVYSQDYENLLAAPEASVRAAGLLRLAVRGRLSRIRVGFARSAFTQRRAGA